MLPSHTSSLPRQIPHNTLQLPVYLGQFHLGQSIDAVNRQSVGCYFSVCKDGLFATDGGAVCTARLQIVVYCVTHGELSHSGLCPVDKGINSGFSCLVSQGQVIDIMTYNSYSLQYYSFRKGKIGFGFLKHEDRFLFLGPCQFTPDVTV